MLNAKKLPPSDDVIKSLGGIIVRSKMSKYYNNIILRILSGGKIVMGFDGLSIETVMVQSSEVNFVELLE